MSHKKRQKPPNIPTDQWYEFTEQEFPYESRLADSRFRQRQVLWFALQQKPAHYVGFTFIALVLIAVVSFFLQSQSGFAAVVTLARAAALFVALATLFFVVGALEWRYHKQKWEERFFDHLEKKVNKRKRLIMGQQRRLNAEKEKLKIQRAREEYKAMLIRVTRGYLDGTLDPERTFEHEKIKT